MKLAALAALAVLLASCASSHAPLGAGSAGGSEAAIAAQSAGLPEDAQRVVQKLAACNHLSGEFAGDRSARDREVNAALTQLHCQSIDEDVRQVLEKYPGNAQLVKALKAAVEP